MSAGILTKSLITAGLALALTASLASAQPPYHGRGMGMAHYDKSTEVTVTGTVEAVLPHQARMGMPGMGGTHLTFKTDSEQFDVHVGPTNWLAEKKFEFAKGDRLEIVGSSLTIGGEKALIAREITKGESKITLRDANGFPLWSGRGRRAQP